MKRIIYTAVALIICASVFGIADYFSAKKQGTLVNYTEDQSDATIKKPEIKSTPQTETITTLTARTETSKKTVRPGKKTKLNTDYSNIVPDLMVTKKKEISAEAVPKIHLLELLQGKITDEDKADSIIQTTNKRNINLEMFSRAPIREKKFKRH